MFVASLPMSSCFSWPSLQGGQGQSPSIDFIWRFLKISPKPWVSILKWYIYIYIVWLIWGHPHFGKPPKVRVFNANLLEKLLELRWHGVIISSNTSQFSRFVNKSLHRYGLNFYVRWPKDPFLFVKSLFC